MEITGEISNIIYKNEINSYTIAELETEEELVTIVGYLPFINIGDTLKLEGKFVEHKEYGRQFKIDTFEKMMPRTLSALERYLSNGNIKGIGEAIAKRIIKKFGDETIHIFKYEPERLAEVRGISEKKAKEMSESFIENWEVWQIVGFLERFGIGAEHAKKVFDLYGTKAIEEIESNPYLLIDIARGVDFKQIDKMALDLGVSYDNDKRIASGIKYGLIRSTYNGHACVEKNNLIEFVINLLDVNSENVEDGLINLKVKEEIVIETREKSEYIYLYNFYQTEREIAYRIKKLQESKNIKKILNLNTQLKKAEQISSIELSEKQKELKEKTKTVKDFEEKDEMNVNRDVDLKEMTNNIREAIENAEKNENLEQKQLPAIIKKENILSRFGSKISDVFKKIGSKITGLFSKREAKNSEEELDDVEVDDTAKAFRDEMKNAAGELRDDDFKVTLTPERTQTQVQDKGETR